MRKKITYKLILSVLVGQSFFLAGCNQVGSSGPGSNAVSKSSLKEVPDDPNSDNDVWVNVIQNDTQKKDSHMAIVAENKSSYALEFKGCISEDSRGQKVSDYVDVHLSDIPGGYSFPKLQSGSYDAKWAYLDHGYGIYDKNHIFDNNLYFHDVDKHSDAKFYCVYSTWVPQLNKVFSFKLVNNWYVASSDADLGHKLDKPTQDSKAMQEQTTLSSMLKYGTEAAIGVTATGGAYAAFLKKVPGMTLRDWIWQQEEGILKKYTERFNNYLSDLKFYPPGSSQYEEAKRFFTNELSSDGNFFQKKNSGASVDEILKVLTEGDEEMGALSVEEMVVVKDLSDSTGYPVMKLKFKNSEGQIVSVGRGGPYDYLGIEAIGINDPNYYVKRLDELGGEYNSVADYIIYKPDVLMPNDIQGLTFAAEQAKRDDIYYTPEIDELANLAEVPMKVGGYDMAAVGGSTVGIAIAAFDYFVLDPLFGKLIDNPGLGAYKTGINHLRLEALTSDELAAINKQLPADQQLSDTTVVTPVNGKNSIYQEVRLSSKDANDDQQFNLAISLNTLENPWVRNSDGSGSTNESPYFGDISFSSAAKEDAAVLMTVSSYEANPLAELDYSYQQTMYEQAGMYDFAGDYRLASPAYTVNQNSAAVNNLALSTWKKNRKTGANAANGTEGDLFLDEGKLLSLNVTLPAALSGKSVAGGGMDVTYVDEDSENGAMQLMSVKNREFANQLLASQDSPTFIYSKFSGKFPLMAGSSTNLELMIGGFNDGKHHDGKLYLADATSRTTYIPVHLGYKLMTTPKEFPTLTEYDSTPELLTLVNAGSSDYTGIEFTNLPTGARAKGCNGEELVWNGTTARLDFPFKAKSSCNITFDLSGVIAGNYEVQMTALSANGVVVDADKSTLGINIAGGW